MKKAAVGFRVHSGWAAMVAASLENGMPVYLSRQRLQLVKIFSYKFRQPYHTRRKDAGGRFGQIYHGSEERSRAVGLSRPACIEGRVGSEGAPRGL